MITLNIFQRKVKIRTFTEMLTSEYLALDGQLSVVEYIALQIQKDPSDLMAVEMDPRVVHRIDNIDINSLQASSLEYKGKTYAEFHMLVYGVHYFSDMIFREKRDNSGLWVFAIVLSYKIHGDFDMTKIGAVYKDLLQMPAMHVIPAMNHCIGLYYKKKVFTIKNLKLFIKTSPRVARALIRESWSFILRKIRFKKSQKYWEKSF